MKQRKQEVGLSEARLQPESDNLMQVGEVLSQLILDRHRRAPKAMQ